MKRGELGQGGEKKKLNSLYSLKEIGDPSIGSSGKRGGGVGKRKEEPRKRGERLGL